MYLVISNVILKMNNTKNKLYVYHKPNMMLGHNYSDDVAITYATTKEEAIKKFKEFYSDVNNKNVSEPYFNYGGVAILTDY